MKYFNCTNGDRISEHQLKVRMSEAKSEMLDRQQMAIGYNVCTVCWQNDCTPIDCSHHVSVKEAKESGRAELCYSLYNMSIDGRNCHKKKDKLNLQFHETDINRI